MGTVVSAPLHATIETSKKTGSASRSIAAPYRRQTIMPTKLRGVNKEILRNGAQPPDAKTLVSDVPETAVKLICVFTVCAVQRLPS